MILKQIIPSGQRITIGVDWIDIHATNETTIQRGSLNVLRVSKSISVIALQVLYGYRCYELAAEVDLHPQADLGIEEIRDVLGIREQTPTIFQTFRSHSFLYRWQQSHATGFLRHAKRTTHPIKTPTDCLEPPRAPHASAKTHELFERSESTKPIAATPWRRRTRCALFSMQRGFRSSSSNCKVDVPSIMGVVYQLDQHSNDQAALMDGTDGAVREGNGVPKRQLGPASSAS